MHLTFEMFLKSLMFFLEADSSDCNSILIEKLLTLCKGHIYCFRSVFRLSKNEDTE